jgi:hypothetical protein
MKKLLSLVLLVFFSAIAVAADPELLERDEKKLKEWRESGPAQVAEKIATLKTNLQKIQKIKANIPAIQSYKTQLAEAEQLQKDMKAGKIEQPKYPEKINVSEGLTIAPLPNATMSEKTEGGYICLNRGTGQIVQRIGNTYVSGGGTRDSYIIIKTTKKFFPNDKITGIWHWVGRENGNSVYEEYNEK